MSIQRRQGNINLPLVVGMAVLGIGVVFVAVFLIGRQATSPGQVITQTSTPTAPAINDGQKYQDYSPAAFASAVGKKRILFFYAAWCPTCRPTDAAFRASLDQIPEDIALFRVNYDTENALKQQYGITYQHTFVWVDDQGNEIRKWNGGALPELITNTRT